MKGATSETGVRSRLKKMALGLDMVGSIPAHGILFFVLGTAYKSNSHRAEEEEVGNNIVWQEKSRKKKLRSRALVVPTEEAACSFFLSLFIGLCRPTSDQPTFRCASGKDV